MSEVQTFEIGINGMACNGCSTNVKGILQKLPGVKEATVDHVSKKATLKVTKEFKGRDVVIQALKGTKFSVI